MSCTTNNDEPAFPHEFKYGDGTVQRCEGMSLRQYAAIHLRVPNSGTDWLDAMIVEAKRDELAAKAMQSYLLDKDRDSFTFEQWANAAYEMADAMLQV